MVIEFIFRFLCSFQVAFLPFALSLDNWRYDVFSGNANKRTMNCHYWNLRLVFIATSLSIY